MKKNLLLGSSTPKYTLQHILIVQLLRINIVSGGFMLFIYIMFFKVHVSLSEKVHVVDLRFSLPKAELEVIYYLHITSNQQAEKIQNSIRHLNCIVAVINAC